MQSQSPPCRCHDNTTVLGRGRPRGVTDGRVGAGWGRQLWGPGEGAES